MAARTLSLILGSIVALTLVASEAHARDKCVETGVAVGETKCSRYGDDWTEEGANRFRPAGSARLVFSAGPWATQAAPTGFASDLGVGTLTAYGLQLQARGAVWNQLTVGASFALAWGHTQHQPVTENGVVMQYAGGTNTDLQRIAVTIGYRVPFKFISLRPELLGGLRTVEIDGNIPNGGKMERGTVGISHAVIQPRLGLDVWITPWLTLDVAAAMSVLDVRDRSVGVSLSWHSRAFDGRASL